MKIDLSILKEIPTREITFRWIDGYYDGILSGFADYQGKLCYFEVYDDGGHREYTLHSLSDELIEKAIREYEEFKARWGDHNDLLADGRHAGGTCRATVQDLAAEADAISAAKKAGTWEPPFSYSENSQVIGWFLDPLAR